MRKTQLSPIGNSIVAPGMTGWTWSKRLGVKVSSEAEGYPVEGALLKDVQGGWRADEPGFQTIRLLFNQPQTIRIIRLVFKEKEFARTQEFVPRWLLQGAQAWKDVVRQQRTFSPAITETECERIQGRPSLSHRA